MQVKNEKSGPFSKFTSLRRQVNQSAIQYEAENQGMKRLQVNDFLNLNKGQRDQVLNEITSMLRNTQGPRPSKSTSGLTSSALSKNCKINGIVLKQPSSKPSSQAAKKNKNIITQQTNGLIAVNLVSAQASPTKIHQYQQQVDLRKRYESTGHQKKGQAESATVHSSENDEEVGSIQAFERRRYSERALKQSQNRSNNLKNVQQIVFEMEEHGQGRESPSATPRTTFGKTSRITESGYQTNFSARTDGNSISNFKTPSQLHLISRETPIFKNKDPQQKGVSLLDTRTLLSDHIKKHIKAVRNSSPRTDKAPSKTQSKTQNSSTNDPAYTNRREQSLNSSVKRPISSIEMPIKPSKPDQSNKENQNPFSITALQLQQKMLRQGKDNLKLLGQQTDNISRYSKISVTTSLTTTSGDIAEETQTNQVNETKTIKEKLGQTQQSILTQPPPLQSSQSSAAKYHSIQTERVSLSPQLTPLQQKFTTNDMQPILDQEKMFFELTKTIMNDKNTSHLNFNQMASTTKQAFDFMKQLLPKTDEKLLHLYLQTCKIELVVQFLIKKMQSELQSSKNGPSSNSPSVGIVHNYIKNVIIHTHQNILFFLEIATLLMGGNHITNLAAKLGSMKQNTDTALMSLQNVCRAKKGKDLLFQELSSILKKIEVMKMTGNNLIAFEQTLISIEAKQSLVQTPIAEKKLQSKILNSDSKPVVTNARPTSRATFSPISQPRFSRLKHASTSPVHSRKDFYLPTLSSRYEYTLVLDLDETLVHFESKERKFKLRPSCTAFLKTLSLYFEIVIFTAASQDYADWILDILDPEHTLIQHRLYRQHTQYDEGVYVKDLSLLGRDLKKTIIIDNIRENFERQKGNGIEIKTWIGDPQDRELDNMMTFLKGMVEAQVKDVRPLISLFRSECWKSPERKKGRDEIDAGEEVCPRGCTPHSDRKDTDAKFVR